MQIPIRTAPSHQSTVTQACTFPGWDQFVTWFTNVPETHLPKGQLPIWSPHVRQEGDNGRRAKGITHMAPLAVLDLDSATGDECQALLTALASAGLAHAWHSSYSHSTAQPKLRVAILLDRQPTAEEWPHVWLSIFTETKCLSDTKCKDTARIYYVPARPPGAPVWAGASPGAPLPVDQLPAPPPKLRTIVEQPAASITLDALRNLAHQGWGRRKSPPLSLPALKALVAGEELAPKGARNDALWQLSKDLVAEFRVLDPAQVAALAEPAISKTGHAHNDYGITVEQFESMLDRTMSYQLAEIAEQHWEQLDSEQREAADLIASTDRSEPYTDEELERWAAQQGVDVDTFLRQRLIIRHGRQVHVFFNGQYEDEQPIDQAYEFTHKYLSPLYNRIALKDDKGEPLAVSTLLQHHGDTISRMVLTMVEPYSKLADHRTFVKSVMPRVPLQPRHHPEVEALLDQPADPAQRAKLRDVFAVAADLSQPCCAVYLKGGKNTGKSLMARGLSALFNRTANPTEAEALLGKFNEQVLHTGPIAFADESLPPELLKPGGTRLFRKLITKPEIRIEGKGKTATTIQGNIRLFIAANGIHLFDQIEDHLTNADASAMGERLLYVDMGDTPLPTSVGKLLWDQPHMIAEHALYLAQTRTVVPGLRLAVEGMDSELHRHIQIVSGVKGRLLHAIYTKLADPGPLVGLKDGLGVVDGSVYASARYLYKALSEVSQREWQPSASQVGAAFRELSEPGGPKGTRRVLLKYLIHWAESTTFGDPQALEESIEAKGLGHGKMLTAGGQA